MLCRICSKVWLRPDLMETNWAKRKWPIRSLAADSECEICRVLHGMWIRTPGFEAYKDGIAKGTIHKETEKTTTLERLKLSLDFVDKEHWQELSCAYTLHPVRPDSAGRNIDIPGYNPELIRSCLDHCDSRHQCLRGRVKQQSNPGFHVIDVKDMCILRAPPECQYVALSYVWGGIIQTRLRKSNVNLFETKHGLQEENLPRTIQDALKICRALDIRYLWVDRLCIVQNSYCHTKSQVARMYEIYSGAYFTIIAATGGNSSSGITPPRPQRLIHHTCRIDNATFVTALNDLEPLQAALTDSIWASRAWTLQEFVLSLRCLVFAGEECFLYCGQGAYVPGLAKRHQIPPPVKFGNSLLAYRLPFPKGNNVMHRRFGRLASCYASRDLSFPQDVLRGFQGITTGLSPDLGTFRWGLPDSIIRWAFCWMQSHDMIPRQGFPSYSWAGWVRSNSEMATGTSPTEHWLSFPDSDPNQFWPPCSVYYWSSPTTMRPIPSRIGPHESQRPDFGKEYDQKHLCNSESAHWIWNVEDFSGKRWRSHRRYKRLLTVRKAAFLDLPDVDFRQVLTFASGVAVLPKQPTRIQMRMPPITPIPMFEYPLIVDDSVASSELQQPLAPQQHYIFLNLLNHVAAVFAVIIPVTIDRLVPGINGDADQLVVRRCGNPCRIKAETWFLNAKKCITHYR